jgi:hypothetical protein
MHARAIDLGDRGTRLPHGRGCTSRYGMVSVPFMPPA